MRSRCVSLHQCKNLCIKLKLCQTRLLLSIGSQKMLLPMHLLLLCFAIAMQPVVRGASSSLPHPGCPDKCGDVDIVYPFGIGPGCAMEPGFQLHCNKSQDGLKNVTYFSDLPVVDISLLQGQVRMMSSIASMCQNQSPTYLLLDFRGSPFTVSEEDNMFTVVGANTLALMAGSRQSAIVSKPLPPLSHAHFVLMLAAGHLSTHRLAITQLYFSVHAVCDRVLDAVLTLPKHHSTRCFVHRCWLLPGCTQ